jgi:large subunit ribosomal protein L17
MRHNKKFNHLGRQRGHRKAMLANMAASLITHKRITTTTAKAKALKAYIEPLITKSKDDTTHSRRQVFSYLQDKDATSVLFRDVALKIGDRPGGYTRIIKLGNRLGDNADMCIIELVDFNETLLAEKAAASKASRRRRGGKKKSEDTAKESLTDTSVEEAVVETKTKADEVVVETETVVEDAVAEKAVVDKTEVPGDEKVFEDPEAELSVDEAPKAEDAPTSETKENTPAEEADEEDKGK